MLQQGLPVVRSPKRRVVARELLALDPVLRESTTNSRAQPASLLYESIALARLPGSRSEAQQSATGAALLAIDRKVQERKLRQDLHWNDRILELYAGLSERDPGLPASLLTRSSVNIGIAPRYGRCSRWAAFSVPPRPKARSSA